MLNTIHGWGISARAHVHIALLYLRNGSTDCVQIWYVGWRSPSTCFPQVMGGMGISARAHVHPHLRISGSEWPNVLKFDVWLETQKLRDLQESEVGWPHSHVRVQFRCLGNRWALALKPHQKQTYLFRARSFIAKHGVLLVIRKQNNHYEGFCSKLFEVSTTSVTLPERHVKHASESENLRGSGLPQLPLIYFFIHVSENWGTMRSWYLASVSTFAEGSLFVLSAP